MRTNEVRFKELGLSKNDKRSRDEWMSILADNPILIERPIVVSGDQAVLGRPPENVLELIGCAANPTKQSQTYNSSQNWAIQ